MIVPELKQVLWSFKFPPQRKRERRLAHFEMLSSSVDLPTPPEIPLKPHATLSVNICVSIQGETMMSSVSVVMEACGAGNLGMIHG